MKAQLENGNIVKILEHHDDGTFTVKDSNTIDPTTQKPVDVIKTISGDDIVKIISESFFDLLFNWVKSWFIKKA